MAKKVESDASSAVKQPRPLLTSVEGLRAIKDTAPKRVEVKEWDCDVLLKKFNGRERQEFLAFTKQEANKTKSFVETLCVYGFVNEEGERLLQDGDFEILQDRDPVVIERLAYEIAELNSLLMQAVEDSAKNSERTES